MGIHQFKFAHEDNLAKGKDFTGDLASELQSYFRKSKPMSKVLVREDKRHKLFDIRVYNLIRAPTFEKVASVVIAGNYIGFDVAVNENHPAVGGALEYLKSADYPLTSLTTTSVGGIEHKLIELEENVDHRINKVPSRTIF